MLVVLIGLSLLIYKKSEAPTAEKIDGAVINEPTDFVPNEPVLFESTSTPETSTSTSATSTV